MTKRFLSKTKSSHGKKHRKSLISRHRRRQSRHVGAGLVDWLDWLRSKKQEANDELNSYLPKEKIRKNRTTYNSARHRTPSPYYWDQMLGKNWSLDKKSKYMSHAWPEDAELRAIYKY